jgi:RNA polymerase sigma factor (sigma-70 family)
MSTQPHSFDADALLAEAGSLHALARQLARDSHAADDLVQDTLLTALERPPQRDGGWSGLRGWLATVLRNRARQRHRGDERRRVREQHVARAEATEGDAGDVEARMLLLRRLADAIAALPEPQRSAVTLRWIDGHTPAEVARAQGITPEAARQRLSRATDVLRRTLDHDYRNRAEWSAIALVLPHSSSATTIASASATKGILMSTTTKIAASVLVVALAVFLVVRPWNHADADAKVAEAHVDPTGNAAKDRTKAEPEVPREQTSAQPVVAREAAVSPPQPTPSTSAIDRERDLHGIVLDPRNRPIAGARIEVTHRNSDGYATFSFAEPIPPGPAPLIATTTSAEDGTFSVALPPGRPHALRVHAGAFADARIGNCSAGERVVVHMSAGASVHGTVKRKMDGSSVEGALVVGYPWSPGRALADPEKAFFTRTDADGRYAATGVAAGAFQVWVQPKDAPDPPWPGRLDIVAGAELSLDFVVESGKTLHGRVTDERTSAPIFDALVGEGGWRERFVHTDRNGEYQYKGCPDRQVRLLSVIADGYGKQNVVVPVLETGTTQTVDVKLSRGRVVRCRVVARDGTPLAGALAAAVAYGDGKNAGDIDERTATSGTDGKVEIGSVRADLSHVLFVRKEGFGTAVHDLPPNELESNVVDLGDVALDPMAIVSGVVVDGKGLPIPAQPVSLVGSNADRAAAGGSDPNSKRVESRPVDRYVVSRRARTDDLGRFSFADVAPGEFRVRAWLEGVEDPGEAVAHVTSGSRVTDLKIVLDEGLVIEGTVFGPDGNAVDRASVSTSGFVGGQSKQVKGQTRMVGGHQVTMTAETNSRGHFRLVGLVEGSYNLSFFCWDEHAETRFAPSEAKQVPAGTKDVVVRLRKLARIEGVVQEDDGTPVPQATVIAHVPGQGPIAERGQPDGSFFIDVSEGDIADLECHRPNDGPHSAKSGKQENGTVRGIAAGTKGVVLRFPPR